MKNAGKACNNRLYRHIRTFEKIVKNYFVIYKEKSGLFRSFRLLPIVPRIAGEKKDDCRPKLHKKYRMPHVLFDKTKFPPCFRVYAFPFLYYTIHKFIFTTGEEAAA